MTFFLWILPVLFIFYILWQRCELKKFRVTHYTVVSRKIKTPVKMLVVSDYHCHPYGAGNCRLEEAAIGERPDLILVPGDMIVSGETEDYPVALQFFAQLSKIAPVFFANGNHESRSENPEREGYASYIKYRDQVEALGIHILNNQEETLDISGNSLTIYGLDIPLPCYAKGKAVRLPTDYLHQTFGAVDSQSFTIMLAHNPQFSEEYAEWGADLVVSGHTHGGLVRIPGLGSLLSPQLRLFPKYDAGEFQIKDSRIIVSRGLGTHTFHIRIFDRAELPIIHLLPQNTISSINTNNEH